MLKIKLVRVGQKNQPHYRVVIQKARTKRDGKYTALLGHYAPTQKPKLLKIDLDAYQQWIAKGAQPTQTVKNLVKRLQSGNPFPPKKKKSKKSATKETEGTKKTETPKSEPKEKTEPENNKKEDEEKQTEEKTAPTEKKQ